MRFLLDIIKEIKAQVGPDYPVCVRLSGTDYEPDGHTIEETIELSKRLEIRGVAAIHMSGGNHHTTIHEVSPMGMSLAHNVWAAEAVKKEVSIPVIASGSINLPDLAESILAEGKGDFIGLGRPLWADPEWPLKAKEGRPEDIRPCIRCNDGCLARGDHIANTVSCTVNVALCREEEFKITPARHPLRVAVVGGGPAGMEAARVCALKGHAVTLYEKRELGGALLEASLPEFKAPDLKPLVSYLKTQVEKTGVKVVPKEATLADLTGGAYEAVIVAAGATPLGLEDIPGISDPKVVGAAQVLHGEVTLGDRVAVIGGRHRGHRGGTGPGRAGQRGDLRRDARRVHVQHHLRRAPGLRGALQAAERHRQHGQTAGGGHRGGDQGGGRVRQRDRDSRQTPWCSPPASGPTGSCWKVCRAIPASGSPKRATASVPARSSTPSTTGIWRRSCWTVTSERGDAAP